MKLNIGQRYSSDTRDALIKFRKFYETGTFPKDIRNQQQISDSSMVPHYRGHIPG